MLRLRRWQRLASRALALCFAVFIGESAWLNACPMHGGRAMASSMANSGAHAGVGDHSTPDAHGVANATESGSSHAPQPQHSPCNCLGHCIGAAILALVPSPVRLPLVSWQTTERIVSVAVGRPLERQAHRLPFATPPPASPSEA